MTEIQIKINKINITLLMLGAIGFTIISVLFVYTPERFISFLFFNTKIIRLIGLVGILFFAIALIFLIPKFFDKNSGLILNNLGIIDNTTANPVGLILWNDITRIEVKKINSINLVLVYLQNPTDYISKANWINGLGLKNNMRNYGTPVTITSISLDCSFEELERLILESYNQSKKNRIINETST